MGNSLAVIFDLDGVMIDTVASLYKIYMNILDSFDVNGSRDEFNQLNGRKLEEIVSFLVQQHCLFKYENEIKKRFETSFSLLYTQIDLMTGILPVLEILKKYTAIICLASSSSRSNIDIVLQRFNLNHFFDFIISGDDVTRAKPYPDIYNLAKEQCNCNEHFVIEDSLNGIQAAQRAGLIAIYYNPNMEPNGQRSCYNISDLSDIPKIVLDEKTIIVSRAKHIEIRCDDRRHPIAKFEEQLANEIWSEALKEKSYLFNCDVASYLSHELLPNGTLLITCFPSQYKYVFAHLHHRRLNLAVPIGISAVTIDKSGKILLGKRSEHVSEYQGYYEFVPSGGISLQNIAGTLYLEQIKTELLEETGINSINIKDITTFGLIYDRTYNVFDICVKLILDCNIDPETLISTEYTAFILMDSVVLKEFIRLKPIVPTSEAMYRVMMDELV